MPFHSTAKGFEANGGRKNERLRTFQWRMDLFPFMTRMAAGAMVKPGAGF